MFPTRSFEIGLSYPSEQSSAAAIEFLQLSTAKRSAVDAVEKRTPVPWTWREFKDYPRFNSDAINLEGGPRTSRRTTKEFSARAIERASVDDAVSKTMLQSEEQGSRGYPSAGGRYPVETYICALRVEGFEPGVYYIDKVNAKYVPLFDESAALAILSYTVDAAASNAPVLFVHTTVIGRSMIKYGGRGLRFALVEVGAIGMKLELEFESLGISSFWVGGFDDEAVSENLGINSVIEMEYPIVVQAFGLAG